MPFRLLFSHCALGQVVCCEPLSDIPNAGYCVGDGFLHYYISISPTLLCLVPMSFVVQKLLSQPQVSLQEKFLCM